MKNRLIAAFLIITTIFSFECYSTKPAINDWPQEAINNRLLSHLKAVKADINETLQQISASEAEYTETAESKEEYMKAVHVWQDFRTLVYKDEKLKATAIERDQALLDMYINGLFNEMKTLEELSRDSQEITTMMFVANALYGYEESDANKALKQSIKLIVATYYHGSPEYIETITNDIFGSGDGLLIEAIIYTKIFFDKLVPIIDAKIAELETTR